jgi:hemerythrin-like domain-containing protein
MKPTEDLRKEHESIKRMLTILEHVAERLEKGQEFNKQDIEKMIDFIMGFADKCHHGKEERVLFPAMVQYGSERERKLVDFALKDHAKGRKYVMAMAEDFVENARNYVKLLRQHISREDTLMWPIADRIIPEEEQDGIYEEFERIEEEVIGHGKHEEYYTLLGSLEKTYL